MDFMDSNLETIPATLPLDCLDGYGSYSDCEIEGDEPTCWGRMFPLGSYFVPLDMSGDSYIFGRGETCDYQFDTSSAMKNPCFQAYSKSHFKITRETTNTGAHTFIHDLSINGTYVNGEKIGKGKSHALNNNDEISMVLPKNKAFVYMDLCSNSDSELPSELRDQYTMSKLLGRGAFGEVRLAFVKGSCRKVAVKVIEKKTFSTVDAKFSTQMMNEVNILKAVQHPCIIAVEDVIDTTRTLFIVMELVEGGELFDRVIASGRLSESISKLLFYQMVLGVKYLHDKGISHRDLKPENILLMSEEQETLIKVTDFGMSKFIDGNTMLKTFCGTPNYLAPEVLTAAGSSSYTKAVDCWSLGVILFICLAGYPPFSPDREDKSMAEQIQNGDYEHYLKETEWQSISDDAKDLLRRLLCVDPLNRVTLDVAVDHKWFQDDEMRSKVNQLMYPNRKEPSPEATTGNKRTSFDSPSSTSTSKKLKTV